MSPLLRNAWIAFLSIMFFDAVFMFAERFSCTDYTVLKQKYSFGDASNVKFHENDRAETGQSGQFSTMPMSICGESPRIDFDGYYDEEFWPRFVCHDREIREGIDQLFETLVQENVKSVKESMRDFDEVGKSSFQWIRFAKVGGSTLQKVIFRNDLFKPPRTKAVRTREHWITAASSYHTCFDCESSAGANVTSTILTEEGARYCRQTEKLQCFNRSLLNEGLLDVDPLVAHHVPYRHNQRNVLRPSALLVLLFREPRARLISSWRHRWEIYPSVHVGEKIVHWATGCKRRRTTADTYNGTFADYLRTCSRSLNNHYVTMLDPLTHNVTVALQRLTDPKALVGIFEHYEDTLNLFVDVLRLRAWLPFDAVDVALHSQFSATADVRHDNGTNAEKQFDKETELLIEEHIRYDKIIYDRAVQLFRRQLKELR